MTNYNLHKYEMITTVSTLAALVLALAHRDTAVSGFWTSKNETELLFKVAKSNAFHLHNFTVTINNIKFEI